MRVNDKRKKSKLGKKEHEADEHGFVSRAVPLVRLSYLLESAVETKYEGPTRPREPCAGKNRALVDRDQETKCRRSLWRLSGDPVSAGGEGGSGRWWRCRQPMCVQRWLFSAAVPRNALSEDPLKTSLKTLHSIYSQPILASSSLGSLPLDPCHMCALLQFGMEATVRCQDRMEYKSQVARVT